MTLYENLTLIIAVLGAVISAVSLVRTRRLDDRQNRFQVKQEELTDLQLQLLRREVAQHQAALPSTTQQRAALPSTTPQPAPPPPVVAPADVRATLERAGGRNHRFVITNWGYGPARNVNFQLRQREGRSSPLVRGDYDEKNPITELQPGDRVTFMAALTFGSGTTFDALLTWQNEDGSEQQRETRVTLD
jgi:hypothetical protein